MQEPDNHRRIYCKRCGEIKEKHCFLIIFILNRLSVNKAVEVWSSNPKCTNVYFNTESLSLRFIGSSDALNVKESKTDKRQQRNTNKNSTLLTV